MLKLLDSCKALVKKANKAEAVWEKNPESAEKENAFNEAYEWQGHELQGSICGEDNVFVKTAIC